MIQKVKNFKIDNSEIIKDIVIFKPLINEDLRGSLYTTFHRDVFHAFLPDQLSFKHDKFSKSYKNVLRGIHGDSKSWKLVTAVFGDIFQVVVDCRQESASYLKWQGFEINQANPISVLLPPGIGNAFFVKSDVAVYHYKLAYLGEYLDAKDQFSVKWNDPNVGIKWPNNNPILSDRDK
jgi:dTDP-4-dehydrorhamnose 3,5-epimerase